MDELLQEVLAFDHKLDDASSRIADVRETFENYPEDEDELPNALDELQAELAELSANAAELRDKIRKQI